MYIFFIFYGNAMWPHTLALPFPFLVGHLIKQLFWSFHISLKEMTLITLLHSQEPFDYCLLFLIFKNNYIHNPT